MVISIPFALPLPALSRTTHWFHLRCIPPKLVYYTLIGCCGLASPVKPVSFINVRIVVSLSRATPMAPGLPYRSVAALFARASEQRSVALGPGFRQVYDAVGTGHGEVHKKLSIM